MESLQQQKVLSHRSSWEQQEVLLPYGPLEDGFLLHSPMAKKANVPVVIHLDHGSKKETCLKALELGFSSIMYDCSTDSYEDNVRKVKEMADIAALLWGNHRG